MKRIWLVAGAALTCLWALLAATASAQERSAQAPVLEDSFAGRDTPSDARVRHRIENLVSYIESIQAATTAAGDTGSRLFRTHCSSCHGASGRGNGPLAESLRHAPPDLTQFTARNGGVFPRERVYRIVDGRDVASHGDREMPVWGDVFVATRGDGTAASVTARIDAIVRYLEGIQQRGA